MGGYTGNIYSIKGYLNDSVSALDIKLTVHKHKELETVDNDYSTTDFNKNRKVKPLSRLSGYKNFKHAASSYYFNDIQKYADLSKKQIKDFIKVFRLEDCKTTEEDFELIKKAVLAEMNDLITRDEKYVLFGSKSEYFNVSKEDLRRVEKIVKDISI